MKAHIGVDSQVLPELLHGQEARVWGDTTYSGQCDVIQRLAPQGPRASYRNRTKSKVRAKVEHAFSVIKRVFE